MLPRQPFYFLRHGETDWNKERRYQGQRDIPLNAKGRAQAENAKALLRDHPIATICSSPLRRAQETAEILNQQLCCPLVVIDGLKECAYGELEGCPKTGPEVDVKWRQGITPPGGEPYREFSARVLTGLAQSLGQPGPVLVVAHRAVYWPLQQIARLTAEEELPNAHPLRLEPPKSGAEAWCATLL